MYTGNFKGEGRPILKYSDCLPWAAEKTAQPIDILFGMWTRKHVLDGVILGQPGEYNWTVHMRRRCGLFVIYFDSLNCLSCHPLQLIIFACVYSAQKLTIFPFKSWFIFQKERCFYGIAYLTNMLTRDTTLRFAHDCFSPAVASFLVVDLMRLIVHF